MFFELTMHEACLIHASCADSMKEMHEAWRLATTDEDRSKYMTAVKDFAILEHRLRQAMLHEVAVGILADAVPPNELVN